MIVNTLVLDSGFKVPWYYGMAYALFDRDAFLLLPVPFNIIARKWLHLRVAWNRFRFGLDRREIEIKNKINVEVQRALTDGRKWGYRDGYEQCRKDLSVAHPLAQNMVEMVLDSFVKFDRLNRKDLRGPD